MSDRAFLRFKSKPTKFIASVLVFAFTFSSSTAYGQGIDIPHALFNKSEVILPSFVNQIEIPVVGQFESSKQ
jgi:mannitol/fructose-specific phosphotransferase system IIA component